MQAVRWLSGQSIGWQTPTGNPVNPFYFGPPLAVYLVAGTGVTARRLVALASGPIALAANSWLSRRLLGSGVAWVSALFPAVLS